MCGWRMPAAEVKQYITFLCKREEEGVQKEEEKTEKRRMRLTGCYSILQQIRETEVS